MPSPPSSLSLPGSPPDDLSPLLDYLAAVGYGELYVPRPRGGGAEDGPRSAPAGRASRDSTSARPDLSTGAREGGRAAAPPPSPAVGRTPPEMPAAPLDPAAVTPTAWDHLPTLDALGEVARGCTRCPLAAGRKQVVFGSGNPAADLMLVGEGPGAEEDRQGLPFVGPAGELLTKIIGAIGFAREDVYIANVVKCRPPGNRDPAPDEVATCRGFLERQIDLVRPKVIVCLGRVAAQTLLAAPLPLSRLRGRWHTVRGVPTRVTFHPAALLRNASWKRPTWEDMQVVRDRLAGS
jgi:uracil-DNA glycosylase